MERKKILVVDDHEFVRFGTRQVLERGGYSVEEAESGGRALELLEKGYRPDLVLLDEVLGHERGVSVLPKIKSRDGGIKVAMFTGDHRRELNRRESLRLGADEYLDKSIATRDLVTAVREILENSPAVELLRHLRALEVGSDFQHSLWDFIRGIEESILSNPLRPHIIGLKGEPGSAKTVIGYQMAKRLLWGGSRINRLAEEHDYILRLNVGHWGDPFLVIPSKGDAPPGSEWNKKQVKESEVVYGQTIQKTLAGYHQYPEEVLGISRDRATFPLFSRNDKIISLTVFDVPAISGVEEEGQVIGLPRADQLMSDLVQRRGLFTGLDYEPYSVGVVASVDVRPLAKEDRQLLLQAETVEQRRKIIRERGIVIHEETDENVLNFEKEGAKPDEIEQIEREVNEVIYWLNKKRKLSLDMDLKSRDSIKSYPRRREQIIGRHILPWFIRRWWGGEIPYGKAIVLYNRKPLDQISIYRDFSEHNPVKELAPWFESQFSSWFGSDRS